MARKLKVIILTGPLDKLAVAVEKHLNEGWSQGDVLGTYVKRTLKHCHGPANAGGVDVTDYEVEGQQMMVKECTENLPGCDVCAKLGKTTCGNDVVNMSCYEATT